MPYQKNPSLNSQKPVNIFYVWYSELCRRLNSNPAPVVKPAKTKCQTVLDFVADRLKVEEWHPVISALRHDTSLHVIAIKSRIGNCQFLHDVDTEEKLRQMKRRSGSLWTAFILKSLLKSLCCTIKNTQVLTCLEFDGLPMFTQYLEPLMKALQKNKTLKTLSLSRCRIGDGGCDMVCAYVRFSPSIEVLVLSGCGLTSQSGEYLSKLIKYQQINRYCESWHNSLRYSEPDLNTMRGIKRITLNDNPPFGDDGLVPILNELDDDLWIKALDLQKCGITDNISARIIDVVQYSQSLEVVDLRQNDQLSIQTMERILDILKDKYANRQPEYQWCSTAHTLTYESILDTFSNYATVRQVRKSRSTPLKQICSKMSVNNRVVRRTKTSDNVPKNNQQIDEKVVELNSQLQKEIAKRIQTERMNEELQHKLKQISSSIQVEVRPKNNVKSIIKAIEKFEPRQQNGMVENRNEANNLFEQICNKNGVSRNGIQHKNGMNGYGDSNGFSHLNGDAACTIFQQLMGRDNDVSSDEESLLDYVQEENKSKKVEQLANNYEMTDSQISLIKFMENLKNSGPTLQNKVNSRPVHSKYYTNDKHVKKK